MTARLLLTEQEAAEALRVCSRTLRKARQEGQLRYVKVGRAVRYTKGDLEAFIDAARQDDALSRPQVNPPTPIARGGGKIIPFSKRV